MTNIKDKFLIYETKFSIVSILMSALVLFVLSIVFSFWNMDKLELLIPSIVGIIVSIATFSNAILVLSSCDGLNAPDHIPTRTIRFLGLSLINALMVFIIV